MQALSTLASDFGLGEVIFHFGFAGHAHLPYCNQPEWLTDLERSAPSARFKMRIAFDQVQGFRERDAFKDAEPFTRMPVVG